MPFILPPTRAQLRTQIANRLGDSGSVRWLTAELDQIIDDALKTWNRAALYCRTRATFPTVANQPFYDLTTEVAALNKTSTTQDAVSVLEYRLLEPQNLTGISWLGSEQFSFAMITTALQKRRDQFLAQSAAQMEVLTEIVVNSGQGRVTIPRASTDIRRVAWKTVEGVYTNLWRVDEETLNRRLGGWNIDAGTPESFSITSTPETVIQLAPVPNDTGSLHIIAVQDGATVDIASDSALGIFEDFTPYLIWGALAELLGQDGPAQDANRAAYCEARWREGLQLAQMLSTSIQVLVNDQAVPVQSLERLDWGVPMWQHTAGLPEVAAQVAPNLIALYKVPDGVYGVTVDIVRNAVLPAADSDVIQIEEGLVGTLIDYCIHVAMFKEGGAEWQVTMPYYKNLLTAAMSYNASLAQYAPNIDILARQSWREREERAA